MTIKQTLVVFFMVLMSIAIFLNIRYIKGREFQSKNTPIENYNIVKLRHSGSYRKADYIDVNYNGKIYKVEVNKSEEYYNDIANGKVKPRFYYMQERDTIFFENQYSSIPYMYIFYVLAIVFPLIGFIVYRKELNNHHSKM